MKIIILMLCVVPAFMVSSTAHALRNPAAVYCLTLGYEYKVNETDRGEVGSCALPNGQTVEEWQFLQGKTAQDYSYCAQNGYGQIIINDPQKCIKFLTDTCIACILPDGREVEVTELMGLSFSETTCGDGVCGFPDG